MHSHIQNDNKQNKQTVRQLRLGMTNKIGCILSQDAEAAETECDTINLICVGLQAKRVVNAVDTWRRKIGFQSSTRPSYFISLFSLPHYARRFAFLS